MIKFQKLKQDDEDSELVTLNDESENGEWEYPDLPCKKQLGETVVILRHITKEYSLPGRNDTVVALNDIHLAPRSEFYPIRRGEFIMLRGPSGDGKTTLLNILGTIDKASDGRVEILGTPITSTSKDAYLSDLRLERIGFVFQTFNLIATMSAFENVELPMIIAAKLSAKDIRARATELLELVGLRDRMNHLVCYIVFVRLVFRFNALTNAAIRTVWRRTTKSVRVTTLLGGKRFFNEHILQQTESYCSTIARALSNQPELLLLDEPTGDLDTKNTIEIMDLLLDINQEKRVTCVMVSHNPDVECYADRILMIKDGRFHKQIVNTEQARLIYDQYIKYLNQTKHAGQ